MPADTNLNPWSGFWLSITYSPAASSAHSSYCQTKWLLVRLADVCLFTAVIIYFSSWAFFCFCFPETFVFYEVNSIRTRIVTAQTFQSQCWYWRIFDGRFDTAQCVCCFFPSFFLGLYWTCLPILKFPTFLWSEVAKSGEAEPLLIYCDSLAKSLVYIQISILPD